MSMLAMSGDAAHQPVRKRRPRHRQIPSLDVTEGRARGVPRVTSPPRRIGKGGATSAERRMISDQMIEDMDIACEPRWKIAAAVGLKERMVYYRLRQIRERRTAARELRDVLADTTLYG